MEFEQHSNNLKGKVMHFTGREVISTSSDEPYIKKRLYKCGDASAAYNVGRVLGKRCLQSGLLEMHTELTKQEETSERVSCYFFLRPIKKKFSGFPV